MTRVMVMLMLGSGIAFADATTPATLRAQEPIVVEGTVPRTLVETSRQAVETPVFDTLGFVDASLSAVEPRGGLTVVKLPSAKLRRRGAR